MTSDSETSREKRTSSRKHKKHHHKKKKHRKKHHKKRNKRDDYYSSDESSSRHKKRKKKRSSRDYSSSDEDSSSDSSRRERKQRRKEKKKKSKSSSTPPKPTFGQYGIIKASDMHKKQRSFQIWLAEVKGIHDFNGPRWELQNYFADYMEDYNTATMPHVKYYDYDAWELQEYQKKQREEQEGSGGKSSVQADEARHRQELRQRAEEKQKAELQLLRQTMNKDKISDMKHKAQLQSELAHAFKTGDVETQRRIQKKLEPEK